MTEKVVTMLSNRLLPKVNEVLAVWRLGRPYVEEVLEGVAAVDREEKEKDRIAAQERQVAEAAEKRVSEAAERTRRMLEAQRQQFISSTPLLPLRSHPPANIVQGYLTTPGPSRYQLTASTIKALETPFNPPSTSQTSAVVQPSPKRVRLGNVENTPPRRPRPFPLDSPLRSPERDGSPSRPRANLLPRNGKIVHLKSSSYCLTKHI